MRRSAVSVLLVLVAWPFTSAQDKPKTPAKAVPAGVVAAKVFLGGEFT